MLSILVSEALFDVRNELLAYALVVELTVPHIEIKADTEPKIALDDVEILGVDKIVDVTQTDADIEIVGDLLCITLRVKNPLFDDDELREGNSIVPVPQTEPVGEVKIEQLGLLLPRRVEVLAGDKLIILLRVAAALLVCDDEGENVPKATLAVDNFDAVVKILALALADEKFEGVD